VVLALLPRAAAGPIVDIGNYVHDAAPYVMATRDYNQNVAHREHVEFCAKICAVDDVAANAPVNMVRDYEVEAKLGKGAFGVVHRVRHRVSGKVFAMKELTLDQKGKVLPWWATRRSS
jgi:hypothetical protein